MERISLERISVNLGGVQALDQVDLHLDPGVILLAGPNGAGKSTLIKILLGLIRPNGGQLTRAGAPIRLDNAYKSTLGYLPEAVAFADNLTGRQIMAFFARARGVSHSHAAQVMERIGLTHAAKRRVGGYSKGMRQRLGLGVAILAQPQLLIMDEPTGGLDQEGLGVLWSILREWKEKGRTVLISSHDLTLMEHRVDRICLLKAGQVLAFGPPGDLRCLAALPVKVRFRLDPTSGDVPVLIENIKTWDRAKSLKRDEDDLTVIVSPDDLLGLMDQKPTGDQGVVRLRVEEPGLDEVYETLLEGVS